MFALGILYLVIPALQVWAFLDPATSHLTSMFLPPPFELANYVVGILCYQWMLANVIVAAKIPRFQRLLPQDARIRFHILGTIGIALSLFYHVAFKLFEGKGIDWLSWSLLAVFVALVALSLLWIPLPGFKRARAAFLGLARPKGYPTERDNSSSSPSRINSCPTSIIHFPSNPPRMRTKSSSASGASAISRGPSTASRPEKWPAPMGPTATSVPFDRSRGGPSAWSPQESALYLPSLELRLLVGSKRKERYDATLFREELVNPAAWDFMVCASPRAQTSIAKELRSLGVPRRAIALEAFAFG